MTQYIHLNGSFQYSNYELVGLAHSISNINYKGDITVQLTLFEACNYACSFCNQANLAKDKELVSRFNDMAFVKKTSSAVNALLKSVNKAWPDGKVLLYLIGGEVTLLNKDTLVKLVTMCTNGINNVDVQVTTNLFRDFSYLSAFNNINASFHTTVLSKKEKQKFLSKAMLLKLQGNNINITHLTNKTLEPTCKQLKLFTKVYNQLLKPWYSWCIENGSVDLPSELADSDFLYKINGSKVTTVSTIKEFGMVKDKVLSEVDKICAPFGWVGIRLYDQSLEYDCSSNCQSPEWPTTKSEIFGKPLRQMIPYDEVATRSNEFIESIKLGCTPRRCKGVFGKLKYSCNACGSFLVNLT